MVFKSFDEVIEKVKGYPERKRMAVAAAGDEHTLQAVVHARREGIIEPLLVGDKAVIDQVLAELGETVPEEQIFDYPDLKEAAEYAVKLVKDGQADFLMKGKLDTAVILKAVVNKENGLGQGRTMSHFTMFEVPTYHKILCPVDGGMVTYPTLEQKKDIINNTVEALIAMGYDCPKVGVLACVEGQPKMPETVEARELKEMNERGEIKNCIVEDRSLMIARLIKRLQSSRDSTVRFPVMWTCWWLPTSMQEISWARCWHAPARQKWQALL